MAETKNTGRYLLEASDMVAVVDGDGNEVGAVPKHWSADQLAAGLKLTSRAPAAATASREDRTIELEAEVARLTEELEAARAGGQGEAPDGNASTEAWAAYALARGAEVEYVKGRSRDQLREEFGPKRS